MRKFKMKFNVLILIISFMACSFLFFGCKDDSIKIEVQIGNEIVQILKTDSSKDYKINIPEKPEDVTTNPNSEKYFYGWFVDSNFQTPLTTEQQFKQNSKIYGKWIDIYSNNFIYSVDKGKATITSFNNSNQSTVVVVPCYINSFPVENIGVSAFSEQTLLRNVIICNGIKNINNSAFSGCNSMESITLPDTLETIGNNAFERCELLTNFEIPQSTTKVGDNAFLNCIELEKITFSKNTTIFGDNVFQDCNKLKTLNYKGTLSDWITNSVGKTAILQNIKNFYVNNVLITETLIIPDNIDSISEYAFYKFNILKNVVIKNNIINIEKYAFGNCSNLSSVTMGENLKNISNGVFSGCVKLNDFVFPNKILFIGDYAFENCISLTDVIIPDNVKSMGFATFGGCINIESLTMPYIKFNEDLESARYFGYIFGANSYNENNDYIPHSLKTVNITSGAILDYAFYGCENLLNVTIDEKVEEIKHYAFYDCKSLETLNYNAINCLDSDFDNYIFSNAGKNGKGIIVNIGANVAKIPAHLFDSENSLKTINYNATNCSLSPYIFSGAGKNGEGVILNIAKNVVNIPDYIFSESKIVKVIFEEDSKCENIGSYAFSLCFSLTEINIPNSVTNIGSWAFYFCSSLTKITIPESLTSIGSCAFCQCQTLTGVYITNLDKWTNINFENAESNPLYYAHNLYLKNELIENLIISSNIHSINNRVFYGATCLKSVIFEETSYSYRSIGASAFYNCSSLITLTIIDVAYISTYAFYNCIKLETINYFNDEGCYVGPNDYIFSNAGQNGKGITVNIGSNVKIIPSNLFCTENSPKITKVIFEENSKCENIGNRAFKNCSFLVEINLPNSVTNIGWESFYGCLSLIKIIIPESVASIDRLAFYECNKITIYSELESKASGWNTDWNYSNLPVYWYSEIQPTTTGNYWHYVDSEIVEW